ncbi:MAG: DUF3791 domain-containing protein [Thermoguttaceae bacterium]|nr:DUF3791 domain-containing protein [Thermoguttaceae bacterium]
MEKKELVFVTFLLWELSEAWGMPPSRVYQKLTEACALDDYILRCYDVLHTQGSAYLVEDITEYVRERGVEI